MTQTVFVVLNEAAKARLIRIAEDRACLLSLKLDIARLRRDRFGSLVERSTRINQLELTLEDQTQAETDAQAAAELDECATAASSRRKSARRPLSERLLRERVIHSGPTTCACCSGTRLRHLGEDVAETLKRNPARWFVIQHVSECFSCSDCETIAQASAPVHLIPRGQAGPN